MVGIWETHLDKSKISMLGSLDIRVFHFFFFFLILGKSLAAFSLSLSPFLTLLIFSYDLHCWTWHETRGGAMKGFALPCHVIYEWVFFFFGFDYLLHIFPLMPSGNESIASAELSNNYACMLHHVSTKNILSHSFFFLFLLRSLMVIIS
jgi:hypothetical protein